MRSSLYFILLVILVVTNQINAQERVKKHYEANWESLSNHETPEWYKDSKLGIFIHWGVYSVPAYGTEWYPRHMYLKSDDPEDPYNHHRRVWGDQKDFGYKDFVPLFKAEKWDPEKWIDLFIRAGATYVIPVAEHHDGFAMYHSSHTRWNSVNMGPKRDILGELFEAGRKRGLKMGASSHFLFNWYYYTHDDEFDTMNPENWDLYGKPHDPRAPMSDEFLNHMWNRTTEIVDRYKPDIMWFDFVTTYPYLEETNKRFAAYYYNKALEWGKEVAINVKGESYPMEAAVHDIERGKFSKMSQHYWQTDNSISNVSWGYIENDSFKPTNTLVDDLVDIVSKNGCILWNIGPKADGTIPDELEKRLLELGSWMDVNNEAINGTRPWIIFGEGPTKVLEGFHMEASNKSFTSRDIRFTVKDNAVYAIVLDWPKDKLEITSFGKKDLPDLTIESISLLGSNDSVSWIQKYESLMIDVPDEKPCDYAFAFKIEVKGLVAGKLKTKVVDDQKVEVETEVLNFSDQDLEDEIQITVNDRPEGTIKLNISSFSRTTIRHEIEIDQNGKHTVGFQIGKHSFPQADILYPFIPLKGEWKMKAGDDEQWIDKKFDDSEWTRVILPMVDKKKKDFDTNEQMIWYRKEIMIPEEYRGFDLELPFGEIWEVDEVYFNGEHIGGQGEFPPTYEGPNYESFWCYDRYYDVPSEIIHFGGENVIAVKVFSKFKPNGPVDEKMDYIQYMKR